MGAQRALGRGPKSPQELDAVLVGLVDRLARRLRKAHRLCRTVVLRLRFDDFTRATRSQTVSRATSQTEAILSEARGLLTAAMPMIGRQGVTLIGASLTNLDDDGTVQLTLPFDLRSRETLDATIDRVRDRFGSEAITRAVLLGRDQGPSVPLLPD